MSGTRAAKLQHLQQLTELHEFLEFITKESMCDSKIVVFIAVDSCSCGPSILTLILKMLSYTNGGLKINVQ